MAVNSFNAQNPPVNTKGDLFTFSTIPTKLGVGTNGQVLSANSATSTGLQWTTPSSGGFTLLSTTAITGGVGSVSVSNIPTTYTELIIVVSRFDCQTDNSTLSFQLNGDTSGSYVFNRQTTSTTSSGNTTGATAVTINTNMNSFLDDPSSRGNIVIKMFRYGTTDAWKSGHFYGIWPHSDGWTWPIFGSFGWKSTSAINRFDLLCNNAFTQVGNIYVYGAN